MILLFLFIIGICVGSFLNVVIDRIPRGQTIIRDRSRCDFCKHVLVWYDLFPLFSFLFLRGRCRYCKKKLSWQYSSIELLTGIMFVGLFLFDSPITQFGLFFFLLDLIVYSSVLSLVVMDSKYRMLSDKVLIVFGLASLTKILLGTPLEIPIRLGIGFLSCLPFFILFFVSKGKAMGFGDVKLSFILGLVLGFPEILIAYYIAFLTGGITAIILILLGKKKLRSGTIAFGPFLFLGWLITSLYGSIIWNYTRLFLGI